jgi:hypothetical protein
MGIDVSFSKFFTEIFGHGLCLRIALTFRRLFRQTTFNGGKIDLQVAV